MSIGVRELYKLFNRKQTKNLFIYKKKRSNLSILKKILLFFRLNTLGIILKVKIVIWPGRRNSFLIV
jgi:hypothetical protein